MPAEARHGPMCSNASKRNLSLNSPVDSSVLGCSLAGSAVQQQDCVSIAVLE